MCSTVRSYGIQFICFAICSVVLLGCEGGDDEQAALSVVNDSLALVQDGHLDKAFRMTTKDFLAQPGKLKKKAAAMRLYRMLHSYDQVSIHHPTPEVEVLGGGNSALVSFPFVVTRKDIVVEGLDGLQDDPEAWTALASRMTTVRHVQVSLVKEAEQWRIRTVRF